MAGKAKVWTQETEQWLLTAAWKRMTLQEIALHIHVNVSVIGRLYDLHDIKPITKRDRIAGKVLDIYNSDQPLPNNKELSLMFDCSDALIKKIMDEYNLISATKQYKTATKQTSDKDIITAKLKALEDYDRRRAEHKELRKTFTVYTQSSSELVDHCRGTHTTLRPTTYLTNNG